MATVVVQQQPIRHSATPPPIQPALSLNTVIPRSVTPIPNKHLPICSPGPAPSQNRGQITPPASPPSKQLSIQTYSILHPPDAYTKLNKSPPIYSIDASTLAAALDHIATQPLPEPKQVFPWLHGLHQENHVQLAFFVARRKSLRRTPKCLRAITLVKAGGDLSHSRLKGSIAPDELLAAPSSADPCFAEVDPREGFSVRNFQIQAPKLATLSDIVVYGDDNCDPWAVRPLAERIAKAQRSWKQRLDPGGLDPQLYHTFVLSSRFREVERRYPELVAVDSHGQLTGQVMDFFQWERQEMANMSKASEIVANVFLGPTPDWETCSSDGEIDPKHGYDIYIEASDLAQMPDKRTLAAITEAAEFSPQRLEVPSSGSIMPPTWSQAQIDGLLDLCRWMYELTNHTPVQQMVEADGDIPMTLLSSRPRKILLHCADGYTETTLLAVAYFMYSECIPVHEAWLRLHCEKKRNFFAYQSDVALLRQIQPRIMQESPLGRPLDLSSVSEPKWLNHMDGSLPSRILPYMYLGNLLHANNPELLRALGIKRILSIGEPVSWPLDELTKWPEENLLMVDRVQDNGIDPLTSEFDRCLEFIGKGKADGSATLVHCRVGVSRSATICIAEVMQSMGLSFPRAYCFVRARRLNVIIQPHLRFAYELLKWEEFQQRRRGWGIKRELEWASIAREIALMNKPYSRQ